MKRLGLKPQGTLQRLKQSNVLGDIIVLAPDTFGDSDRAICGAVNYHSNTGWAGIPERAAIDVGHEILHCGSELVTTMPDVFSGVKMFTWSLHTLLVVAHAFEHLWM